MGRMPKLELVVRGLKREQAGSPSKPRLPITPAILRQVHSLLKDSRDWDNIMMWAVMCLCFFGFLRSGEVVAPDDSNFDPAQHLSFRDITVDSLTCPSCLSVKIKQSKTDPFRVGVTVIVGRTREDLCPIAAVLAYMTIRGSGGGPLFYFKDGRCLTRQRLVSKLREILQRSGIDHQKYSGHSFCIGVATTAASWGVQDSLIKTIGHWESVAYQLYVRTPREQLVAVTSTLAKRD